MIVYKSYFLCGEEHASHGLPDRESFFVRFTWRIVSAYPDWFDPTIVTGDIITGWTFIMPSYLVDLEITLERTTTTPFGHTTELFKLLIETDTSCGLVEYDTCCDNACSIAWINRQGGWQNYLFPGVKEWRVEVGYNNTFKNEDLQVKFSEVQDVYNGKICSTGDIPKSHVDLLDSLQYSIQAFMWNEDTDNWDIPILIDKKSFQKYKTRDKFFDVKVRFIFAEELIVQGQ